MRMQLTDALCYVLLTITMTATCAQVEGRRYEIVGRKGDRRLNRRDATIIVEGIDRGYQRPSVVYKQLIKQRYGPPKTKYGPPSPKFAKKYRNPTNKSRNKPSSKYRPQGPKKNPQRARVTDRYKRLRKPVYGAPKKHNYSSTTIPHSEPMGFAEPPRYNDYQPQNPEYNDFHTGSEDYHKQSESNKPSSTDFYKPSFEEIVEPNFINYRKPAFIEAPLKAGYAEPPVDSYGAPLKPNLRDLSSASSITQNFPVSSYFNDLEAFGSSPSKTYPKKRPAISNLSTPDQFLTPDADEEMSLNSYSDIYNYRQKHEQKAKKQTNQHKFKNQWNGRKKQVDDEIVVGGQYAEPPARYVPKLQPSALMFSDFSEFAPIGYQSDPDLVASATTSPYLNYKHSNMAFSPQNLNDAFSIIE